MFVLRGCERDGMDAGVCRSTTTTNETNQPQITENPPLLFVPRNNLNSLIKHSTGLARTTIPASAMKQITPDTSNGHNRSVPISPSPFCPQSEQKILPPAKPSLPNHTPRYHPTIPSLHLYMGKRCDTLACSLQCAADCAGSGSGLDPLLTYFSQHNP